MQYFGDPYPLDNPAPAYVDQEQVETPIGMACASCRKFIKRGDQGWMIPNYSWSGVEVLPWHRHCFLESILGPDYESLLA